MNETTLNALIWQCLALLVPKSHGTSPTLPDTLKMAQSQLPPTLHSAILQAQLDTLIEQTPQWPLTQLYHMFGFTHYEWLSIALVQTLEYDADLANAVRYLQFPRDDARPSIGLLQRMLQLFNENDNRLSVVNVLTQGIAKNRGLIKLEQTNRPICEQSLLMSPHMAQLLSKQTVFWPGCECYPYDDQQALPASLEDEANVQLQAWLQQASPLIIYQQDMREAKKVAAYLAMRMEKGVCLVNQWQEAQEGISAFCRLLDYLPVYVYDETMDDRSLQYLPAADQRMLVVTHQSDMRQLKHRDSLYWSVSLPTVSERTRLWQDHGIDPALASDLGNQYRFSSSHIRASVEKAQHYATLGQRTTIQRQDILRAGWDHDYRQLEKYAYPIKDHVQGDTLVLPELPKSQLALLKNRCLLRERLPDWLGNGARQRYRSGIKVLLNGPPGTGKTLAASWLATELATPLYCVDLASISSKYIGETEKQLSGMLDAAEQSDVLLLFDEADALFGRRTDIQDANDRYANAQTNYLLQRIEAYDGVVILTSNYRDRFDPAFFRRLDMVIDLPSPSPELRRQLWLHHLGEHNLTATELNLIAFRCGFSGGHIRNACLAAAALAGGKPVDYPMLLQALRIEYQKLDQSIPSELLPNKRDSAQQRHNPDRSMHII